MHFVQKLFNSFCLNTTLNLINFHKNNKLSLLMIKLIFKYYILNLKTDQFAMRTKVFKTLKIHKCICDFHGKWFFNFLFKILPVYARNSFEVFSGLIIVTEFTLKHLRIHVFNVKMIPSQKTKFNTRRFSELILKTTNKLTKELQTEKTCKQ